jgi:hypothetical protein
VSSGLLELKRKLFGTVRIYEDKVILRAECGPSVRLGLLRHTDKGDSGIYFYPGIRTTNESGLYFMPIWDQDYNQRNYRKCLLLRKLPSQVRVYYERCGYLDLDTKECAILDDSDNGVRLREKRGVLRCDETVFIV